MAYIITIPAIIFAAIVVFIVYLNKNPFEYPYFRYEFDMTGVEDPDIDRLIDEYVLNSGMAMIDKHYYDIEAWKIDTRKNITNGVFYRHRMKQFQAIRDDAMAFVFTVVKDGKIYSSRAVSYIYLHDRYIKAQEINN